MTEQQLANARLWLNNLAMASSGPNSYPALTRQDHVNIQLSVQGLGQLFDSEEALLKSTTKPPNATPST